MSIWNKVFLGLTILVAVAFFVLAARALAARDYWGESIKLHEDAIAALTKDRQLLVDGNPAETKPGYQEGLRRLKEDVHRLLIGRGRVWRNLMPSGIKPETGEVTVMTPFAAPHKDAKTAQMFLFEDASDQTPGAYLGEFSVAEVANQQWQLKPVRAMTDAELQRLRQSTQKRATWSLYEALPDKPMDVSAKEPLTDYYVLFSDFYRQRASLNDLLQTTTSDVQAVEAADASARQQVDLLQKEIASTKEELKAMLAERDLVAKHRQALEAKLAEVKDAVQKTDQVNRAVAGEIARLQLEAKRRIDERTSKIARAQAAR